MANKNRFKTISIVLVILFVGFVLGLFFSGTLQVHYDGQDVPPPSFSTPETRSCPEKSIGLSKRLESTLSLAEPNCFLAVVEDIHFSRNRTEVFKATSLLAKRLDNYYRGHTDGVLHEPYTRLSALNVITNRVLTNQLKFDRKLIRTDVMELLSTDTPEVRSMALTILGYFSDDADISIFLQHIKSGSEEEIFHAITALAHHCSPKAKTALREGMKYQSVRKYLEKYKEKESITSLLSRECPI